MTEQPRIFWVTLVPEMIVQTLALQEFWFHLPVSGDDRQVGTTQVTCLSSSQTASFLICGSVHSVSQATHDITWDLHLNTQSHKSYSPQERHSST